MAMIPVANTNATITSDKGGSVTVTSSPSTKVNAEGAGVYAGGIGVSLIGAVDSSCVQTPTPATGTISPSATKVNVEGQAANREGDSVDVTVLGTDTSQNGAPCSFTATITVDAAGQSKVRAE